MIQRLIPGESLEKVFLIGILLLAFSPSLGNGFLNIDDSAMIFDNPLVQDFSLASIQNVFQQTYLGFYQPLTLLSFGIEVRIWGLDMFVFHLDNLILHMLNCFLVLGIARALVGGRLVPFLTCLLFAIHPSRVDSVAWITERKDVLFAFFYFLGILCHVKLKSASRTVYHGCLMFCFLLSVCSKPMALSFPVSLVLIDVFFSRETFFENLKGKSGLFVLAALATAGQMPATLKSELYPVVFPFSHRLFMAFCGIGIPFQKLFLPWKIPLFFPLPLDAKELFSPVNVVYSSVPILLLVIFLWKRQKPLAQFGMLFFALSFLPVYGARLTKTDLGQELAAIRYAYLPAFGLFLLLSIGLERIMSLSEKRVFLHKSMVTGIALLFLLLGFQTRQRCEFWSDSVSFWNQALKDGPCFFGFICRGLALANRGDRASALEDFKQAVILNSTIAEGWFLKATVEKELEKWDDSENDLKTALALEPKNAKLYHALGQLFLARKNPAAAIENFQRATALDPRNVESLNDQAIALKNLGRLQDALKCLETAATLFPDHLMVLANRAKILHELGDPIRAQEDETRVKELVARQKKILELRR